jgi:hypothetical protein
MFAAPEEINRYNVVWDSPSADAHGSMPIGNGDVGANVWVEPSGDLLFYINKTDAWDENCRLCKIGRVRVKFEPALAVAGGFRQELKLSDGVIEIRSGNGGLLKFWVAADEPVVRLESEFSSPVTCRAEVELWRLRERPFGKDDDSHSGGGLANSEFKPTVLPDTVVPGEPSRVTWYHRNTRSIYGLGLQVQHLESLAGAFKDPLLNHTFGACITGPGFVRDGEKALKSARVSKKHELSVTVMACQSETPDEWLRKLDKLARKSSPSLRAHKKWWSEFWDRSWIFVDQKKSYSIPANTHQWKVGEDSSGGSRFRGEISDARVVGSVLTPEQLAELPGRPRTGTNTVPRDVDISNGCTVSAWIKPASGEAGRILDKCTVGRPDGLTFDTHPGLSLRWIVGDKTLVYPNCLKAGEWQHVAATADGSSGTIRIYRDGRPVAEIEDNLKQNNLTSGYILQRYMNACSGRGGSPIKFNGSIFTVEDKPGASPETPAGDPDWRRWGGNYWFQNTRLAYWPMLASGDFDTMLPWFRMYKDALPLSKARINTYYKFQDAAQFPETMYFWGLPNNGDYGWKNSAPEPANSYIRRYWNGSLELAAVLLDYYDYTRDKDFAREMLVPLAGPLVSFLDQYWQKRDANGKIVFDPAQSLETWHVAVNPLPEIAGLRFLLPRLLALPEGTATEKQRQCWKRILGELPDVPIAEVDGKKVLRPAVTFSAKANSENTELYSVFPYRLYGVGRPDLEMARNTYAIRLHRHNHGWCQDSIQAACLGLADEAGRLVTARAGQMNRAYRFPVMWGPNFDWIPDQDHGNNILTTLQFMLLQADVSGKIYLLPAWPKDWDCEFKLYAPLQTVVEGKIKDGRITRLEVSPEERRKDIVMPDSSLFAGLEHVAK